MSRRDPPGLDPGFEHPGYCPCCRSETQFLVDQAWLRDHYICTQCRSIPRQRHLQTVLDTRFSGWEGLRIHESSPSSDFIGRFAENYTFSQLIPGVAGGEFRDGVRCEDIERLTFPDDSIDLFITQDVLEHVFDPRRAVKEIHRVLRPGGAHIFTTPKHPGLIQTVQRARLSDAGTVEALLEEQYHDSPIGDGRALVTYDYGHDFESLLSTWAGASVVTVHTVDRSRGLDAEFNEVFLIGKPLHYPHHSSKELISRLQGAVDTRDRRIAALQDAIAELRESTSWRATAPLRAATKSFRSLRKRSS